MSGDFPPGLAERSVLDWPPAEVERFINAVTRLFEFADTFGYSPPAPPVLPVTADFITARREYAEQLKAAIATLCVVRWDPELGELVASNDIPADNLMREELEAVLRELQPKRSPRAQVRRQRGGGDRRAGRPHVVPHEEIIRALALLNGSPSLVMQYFAERGRVVSLTTVKRVKRSLREPP